jgi:hypothetical protein
LQPATIDLHGAQRPAHWACGRCGRTWPFWSGEAGQLAISGTVYRGGAGKYDEQKAVAGARRANDRAALRRRLEARVSRDAASRSGDRVVEMNRRAQ